MESMDALLKEELSEGTLAALQEFLRDKKLGESEESEEGEEAEGGGGATQSEQQAPGQVQGPQGPNNQATLDPLSSSLSSDDANGTSSEGRQGSSSATGEEGGSTSRSAARQKDKTADVIMPLAREEARFRENWGLSQFWYEDSTAEAVAEEVIRISAAQGLPAQVPAVGASEGAPEGAPEGASEGAREGAPEGAPEGAHRLPVACIACPTLFRRLRVRRTLRLCYRTWPFPFLLLSSC